MSSRVPTSLLLVVGLLLAETAWLLAVPAFRGLDEFDHVFRAASVARGEWLPSGAAATDGRGELVSVPGDIVTAAGPECRARPYTGPDNCAPVSSEAHGQVRVATAAARYEPGFYWVIGTAARWAHGTTVVYVMRSVAALLCALFVGLSVSALRRWASTPWPVAVLAASMTPVVAYSAIVAAPNALEICAATSVWVALGGLGSRSLERSTERWLVWAAVPGAAVLANLRTLGIPFLGLVVLVVAAVLGTERLRELWHRHRSTVLAAAAVVGCAVLVGLVWLILASPNRLEEDGHYRGGLATSLLQLPVWVLQTIAAAPGRTDPAPVVVYLLCGSVLAALLHRAHRHGERRLQVAIAFVALSSVIGPLVLTLCTFSEVGVVWQGRYGMPFSVGILALTGLALDRSRCPFPPTWTVAAAVSAFTLGQLIAVLHVLEQQRQVSPSVPLGLWTPPSPWLLGLLTVGGWALVGTAVLRRHESPVDLTHAAARQDTGRGSAGVEARVGGG